MRNRDYFHIYDIHFSTSKKGYLGVLVAANSEDRARAILIESDRRQEVEKVLITRSTGHRSRIEGIMKFYDKEMRI
jgi:hypothetical protein